jgi:hypothetical protein
VLIVRGNSLQQLAMPRDWKGSYGLMDLRDMDRCEGSHDGIFASGCLYHLTKPEFAQCVRSCWALLSWANVFRLNIKEGHAKEAGADLSTDRHMLQEIVRKKL